ncbi:MAG TPA: HAMP domain-containing sensor histidine kinase [Paludibacter sp.]
MNNSINKSLLNNGIAIPLDFYSYDCSQYPLLDAISSELHPPVTIIQSQIQLLKRFCNYSDKSLMNETFSLCDDSIENIQGFIEKIDFLCTSDINRVRQKPRWFSLRLLINHVFAELRHQNLDISRIQLNNTVPDYNIFPDKYLFCRILVNLLSNALKFSKLEVELSISTTGSEFTIVVRDTGIGIPENQIIDVFIPFVRGNNVNKIKGSGLGLTTIAYAVKCINGSIILRSEVGKGTEFTIIFPYSNEAPDLYFSSHQSNLPDQFKIDALDYNQIIGTISHELRTSVAILKSNIQILKRMTIGIENEIKDECIFKCEASLADIQQFFEWLPLLNLTKKSGVNLYNSALSKLNVN